MTRLDPAAPAGEDLTRVESAAAQQQDVTRIEPSSAEAAALLGRAGGRPRITLTDGLPGDLGVSWQLCGRLPAGGEASLLLVRPRAQAPGGRIRLVGDAGRRWVLKLYDPERRPDDPEQQQDRRAVWAAVSSVRHDHVQTLGETGTAGRHDYEISPYWPDGSLEDAVRATVDSHGETFEPWQPAAIRELVRQLDSALAALHAARLVHRDVKPGNILVRCRDPLHVVLGDYGIALLIDGAGRFTSRLGTPRFMPPEAHVAGLVWDSPARDYWALGMVVLELTTGVRGYRRVHDAAWTRQLAGSGVDVSMVVDDRVRLLCQGLLTRDQADRWGHEEISRWLAGGTPAAGPADAEQVTLSLRARRFQEPAGLAAAISADPVTWATARRRFLPVDGGHDSGEGWRQLVEWLRAVRPRTAAGWSDEDLAELLDHRLRRTGISADVRLLHLVRWLDPAAPPSFRGIAITPESLRSIAYDARGMIARGRQGQERQLVDQLRRERVLPLLAQPVLTAADGRVVDPGPAVAAARRRLAAVAEGWDLAARTLPRRAHDLAPAPSGWPLPTWLPEWANATGLWLAADPTAAAAELSDVLGAETARFGPWAPRAWSGLMRAVGVMPPGGSASPAASTGPQRRVRATGTSSRVRVRGTATGGESGVRG
ncbi:MULTISPECIES: protein kinase domain-containing protein [Frankia]|uniref:Serine/threonine protein kinase n=1 Tax=Frankia alni (strain DSM 45986 / CECT 9034 / ACN14a) TaxID=326424 RepID=Q0RSE8_FRAAA|nr:MULTISPECIES: protein kinase [Frankia]CAJ59515.1 Putative serine/threonine protein kinase [Frankia alni ACN14a]